MLVGAAEIAAGGVAGAVVGSMANSLAKSATKSVIKGIPRGEVTHIDRRSVNSREGMKANLWLAFVPYLFIINIA